MKKIHFFLPILAMCLLQNSNAFSQGIISTITGGPTGGFSGDNGPASAALIYQPQDVALDAAGNVYFTDALNHRIRKIDASTAVITTIAGIGAPGYSGDGGLATSASIAGPGYLCLDGTGNLYFTDTTNSIRKINLTSGIITTIAHSSIMGNAGDGGPASAAQLAQPLGICYWSGKLYFADKFNNEVRMIDLSTNIITTVAGNYPGAGPIGDGGPATAAALSVPYAVRTDAAGNLFIADLNHFRIRKVDHTTNIITTVAGNGTGGFAGDGGLASIAEIGAVDGIWIDVHGDIYINDQSCSCRKIDHATGIIHVVAGDGVMTGFSGDGGPATAGLMNNPGGLYVDPANGNIIIADVYNNRIRKATQPSYVVTLKTENNEPSHFSVYPDPSEGKFMVSSNEKMANSRITVQNILGEVVYSSGATSLLTIVDITDQPSGNYYVRIEYEGGSETKQILKR